MLFFGSKWNELCKEWQCTAAPKFATNRVTTLSLRRPAPASNTRGIAHLMTQRLLGSPYVALHELRCQFSDGTLTLCGRVPTFHTKQIAISMAAELEGVIAIVDMVEVTERPQETATS